MMTDIGETGAAQVQMNFKTELNQIDGPQNSDQLAKGILEVFQPSLQQMKNELDEMLKRQNILVGKMQLENEKLVETAEDGECLAMYSIIKGYQEKLFNIKREMGNIHDRTIKLKKRALRLQQIKQREAITKEQKHEKELQHGPEPIGNSTSM